MKDPDDVSYRSITLRLLSIFLIGILAISVVAIYKVTKLDLPVLEQWRNATAQDEEIRLRDAHLWALKSIERRTVMFFESVVARLRLFLSMTDPEYLTPAEQRLLLGRLLREMPELSFAAIYDGEGRLAVSAHPPEIPASAVTEGLRHVRIPDPPRPAVFWGEPYAEVESRVIAIGVGASMGEADGPTLWVEVDLSLIQEWVVDLRVDGVGYAAVVDGSGRLVVHPHLDRALAREDVSEREIVKAFLSDARSGLIEWTGVDGDPMVGMTRRIPYFAWGVYTAEKRENAFRSSDRVESLTDYVIVYTKRMGLFTLSLVFFLLLYALISVRRTIVHPLRKLREGHQRLAAGDLDHVVLSDGLFDDVARTIDSYNEAVKSLRTKLESKEGAADEGSDGP